MILKVEIYIKLINKNKNKKYYGVLHISKNIT